MGFRLDKVKHNWDMWRTFVLGRFMFDLKHLWSNAPNPFDDRLRPARVDITHAWMDLFVEGVRMNAYLIGHVIGWLVMVAVFFVMGVPLQWLASMIPGGFANLPVPGIGV